MTATAQFGRVLRFAAGLCFVGLLIYAPLNFGSTRAGGAEFITRGCFAATLFWCLSCVFSLRRPQVPAAVVLTVTLFFVAALPWLAGLALATPVSSFTQTHFARVAARWPFSIVWRTPENTVAFTLALAVSAFPLIDLARTRGWALAFGLALASAAVVVAALALAQNYTHATGIYWRDGGRMPGNFCGTFYHHTAAGAYFNTAWPLAVALTWLAWDRSPATPLTVAFAVTGALATIVLIAAHGSHVSRFPQVAALFVSPFLLRGLKLKPLGRRAWWFAAIAVAVALLIAAAGRTADIRARWQLVFASAPIVSAPIPPAESSWPALVRDDLFIPHTSQSGWLGDRGEGWRTALRAISDRTLTGHGPANWMGAASQHTDDPFVRTFFQFLQFAHQDVLQFAVEWGVPAALGWWGLFAGAVVAVLRVRSWLSPLHRQVGIATACALTALLLQAQLDFPFQMPAIALNALALAALCWAGATEIVPTPASAVPAPLS